jgi:aryl-alcohol dehydrogenase-like predicted oxidoreductase
VSAGAVTLAWVRAQGKTVVPIPGASTIEHALDSARAMMVDVTEAAALRITCTRFDSHQSV